MLIGCLALAGFPLFSGFFSKDDIVGAAANSNTIIWLALLLTGFLTAYYTFRLYFQVFQGPLLVPTEPADGHAHASDHGADDHGHDDHAHGAHGAAGHHEEAHHNHEPMLMILPLVVLAIGALFGGLFNVHWNALGDFLGKSPSFRYSFELAQKTHHQSLAEGYGQPVTDAEPQPVVSSAMIIGGLIAIAGIALAYMLHLKDRAKAEEIAKGLQPMTSLLEAKYYVDEIYQAWIIEPLRGLGETFFAIDRYIVDGLVATVSAIPQIFGFTLKFTIERGYLQGYAATMFLGIAAILLFIFG
jgi:NADH:ubiquinone oxidoreductase subunit 5 (subunit L)/multisubunit Na+/H+ antiporter MnhA subunit